MTLGHTRFETRLRAGLHDAVADLRAPAALDVTTVERRISGRARRRVAERVTAGAVLVALVGGLVAVVDRSDGAPDREFRAGAPTPRTGEPGWATIAEAPTAPRFQHTVVWTGTEALVLGGYVAGAGDDPSRPAGPAVVAYDPVAGTWRAAADLPTAGGVADAAWTGDRVLVLDDDGALHAYDPATDSWAERAHSPWDAASTAITASVWTGTELVVANATDDVDAVAAYDPATDRWRAFAAPPVRTTSAQVLWTGTRVVVLGETRPTDGRAVGGVALATVDPVTGTWTTVDDVPLAHADRRASTFAVWTGTELVVGGGVAQTDEGAALAAQLEGTTRELTPEELDVMAVGPLHDVAAWDPVTDTWRPLPDVALPGAVWTNERWPLPTGGTLALLATVDDVSNVGEPRAVLFDAAAGTWTEVPPSPTGWQQGAPAVWTGEEFLVWSGEPTATDADPVGCCVPTGVGQTLTP